MLSYKKESQWSVWEEIGGFSSLPQLSELDSEDTAQSTRRSFQLVISDIRLSLTLKSH